MMNKKSQKLTEIDHQIVQNAQILIPEDGVAKKINMAKKENRPLRIKMGFDPTSPDLHLGHAVAMQQLKRFQDLGHLPVIIIGDFTGRIGDPSDRNKSRPLVGKEDLQKNSQTYLNQLGKILDIDRVEIRRNSEWLEAMSLTDVVSLLSQGSLAQVISREDFRKRLDLGSPIALHEIIYPFLQGKDSVAVRADIEVGGVDQLYAFQAGRLLQTNNGDDPQALILMPLLRGLDGHKKMSKTLNNYVGLNDVPREMFGKLMSMPDSLIEEYLRLASTYSNTEVDDILNNLRDGVNPIDIKMKLAHNITALYHGPEAAQEAEEFFNNQFRGKSETQEYVDLKISVKLANIITVIMETGVVDSTSKARRLIEQGAVTLDGKKCSITNLKMKLPNSFKMKIGKRGFFSVTLPS